MFTVESEGISMKKGINQSNVFLTIAIVCTLLTVSILPVTLAADTKHIKSFDKGPSYKPVAPIKKITMVNFDEETYLDDYAYLAAVPTSVFNDGDKLFSHPLLFYQDEYRPDNEKELPINARKGIDYFMEDWIGYCNGKADQMTLINVPQNKLDSSWKAKKYTIIEDDNPYDIASNLALNEWSYSDSAVIAVIEEEFEKPDGKMQKTLDGSLPSCKVHKEETFDLKQTNSLNPMYHTFDVDDGYKYLDADCWWDGILLFGGFIMMPTGDPDMQLYCKDDEGWMQTAAVAAWNVYSPIGHEPAQAYIYESGKWRVGITDMPTEGDNEVVRKNILGNLLQLQGSVRGMIEPGVTYHVDITMYPGIDVEIPDLPPFGCRNVEFKLTWDNPEATLGFTLVGPSGEAILTALEKTEDEDYQKIKMHSIGECLDGEHYTVSVFSMNDITSSLDFKLEYSWEQNMSEMEGNSLTSATEGAVLASGLNAPLLYTSFSEISDGTKDALYKLGVKNIYLVNIGDHLSEDALDEIEQIAAIKENYKITDDIYKEIRGISGSNDIVFSTLDPWTYWYMEELAPGGETEKALFLGPAAYIAAHHGTPVLIVDVHPELSSAVTYHNEMWRHFSKERYDGQPSSGEMVLTGRRIYDFLKKHDFDKEGDENIITVADQFDIGVPWDRIFIGVANSGRFCGSPVDSAYWISRNMFYPALIFENPAMNGDQTYIMGSSSHREGLLGLIKKPFGSTLVIDPPEQEVKLENAVLCSFVTQKYRFNERASKYYGAVYECADGLVPGQSVTNEPIDMGSIQKHTGKEGAYFPDMSETEMVPFYLEKGGFNPVFSTKFEAVADNINNGVILWIHASHGSHGGGGKTEFWDPQGASGSLFNLLVGSAKEENPKFGYDWYLGSTEEPDTMSMDIKGMIPFTNHNSLLFPATGFDYVLARKPLREIANKIIFPKQSNFPFNVENLYDGVTGSLSFTRKTIHSKYSTDLDEAFGNLHSAGFITNICQTAYTNFQLTMIRHGTTFQVEDPWATSWYATVWRETIPRDLALGYTMGEAFARGIKHVGILYLGGAPDGGPQWWWDTAESVIYFGDPELRVFVPSTEYSDANNWDRDDVEPIRYDAELNIDGHMPFGATSYPNEKQPKTFLGEYLILVIAIVAIVVLVGAIAVVGRKKK
jgi:hypothetical protein